LHAPFGRVARVPGGGLAEFALVGGAGTCRLGSRKPLAGAWGWVLAWGCRGATLLRNLRDGGLGLYNWPLGGAAGLRCAPGGALEDAGSARRAGQIIAVGGGKGGAGKTVLSTNLSVALAERGHRVLLVDADLGGANVHTVLGVPPPLAT